MSLGLSPSASGSRGQILRPPLADKVTLCVQLHTNGGSWAAGGRAIRRRCRRQRQRGMSAALSARERGASVAWSRRRRGRGPAATRTSRRAPIAPPTSPWPTSARSSRSVTRMRRSSTSQPTAPTGCSTTCERVTQGRADPQLARILADESAAAAAWLGDHGVRWKLLVERQSFRVDGRIRFWGNLVLGSVDGGRGLVEAQLAALERAGVELRFDSPMTAFRWTDGRISGVTCNGSREIEAGAVVIAAGGFESDAVADRRISARRGALRRSAARRTTPARCSSSPSKPAPSPTATGPVATLSPGTRRAPPHGDRELTNRYSRQAYPFGLVVNRDGRRFLDEGADFRNYTYAKYGAEILRQPEGIAYQLFDAQTLPYLSEVDYATATTSRVEAESIEELEGCHRHAARRAGRTIEAYNRAVRPGASTRRRRMANGPSAWSRRRATGPCHTPSRRSSRTR